MLLNFASEFLWRNSWDDFTGGEMICLACNLHNLHADDLSSDVCMQDCMMQQGQQGLFFVADFRLFWATESEPDHVCSVIGLIARFANAILFFLLTSELADHLCRTVTKCQVWSRSDVLWPLATGDKCFHLGVVPGGMWWYFVWYFVGLVEHPPPGNWKQVFADFLLQSLWPDLHLGSSCCSSLGSKIYPLLLGHLVHQRNLLSRKSLQKIIHLWVVCNKKQVSKQSRKVSVLVELLNQSCDTVFPGIGIACFPDNCPTWCSVGESPITLHEAADAALCCCAAEPWRSIWIRNYNIVDIDIDKELQGGGTRESGSWNKGTRKRERGLRLNGSNQDNLF